MQHKKIVKIKTIVQLAAMECSAACLAMILAYYGKFVSLEQLKLDCKINKHGATAKNIVYAAKQHGLLAFGVRTEPQELKTNGQFPCIIHWNFNHFVVLAGFKKNKAVIHDPANGIIVVDFETFSRSFTGICLNFKPGKNFKAGGKPKTTTKFLIQTIKSSILAFVFFVIVSVITLVISLANPGFLHFLVDQLLTRRNKKWILGFSALAIATTIASLTTIWLKTVQFPKIQGKLNATSNCNFMWKLLHLPLEFFASRLTGEIQMRQKFNASIANQIVSQITPLILNIVNITIFFVIMLRYSVLLTTTIGFASLAAAIISKLSLKKQLDICKVKLKLEGKLNATLAAGLSSIESIKLNGTENHFFQKWANAQANLNSQMLKDPLLANLPKLITNFSLKTTIILGAILIIKNQTTLGAIISFNAILKMLIKPFNNFFNTNSNLQTIKTKIERVEDVLNFRHDSCFKFNKSSKNLKQISGQIEIKNLKYSHPGETTPTINNLNLKIKSGEKIAIIGPAGCGKTTLVQLITGLLKQQQGQILFNNKKINEIDKNIFRNSVVVVNHKPFFFYDTIKNNLKMWNSTITDLELIEATKKAQIYFEILSHGGFNSKILENAKNFSSGQKQQLDIARAFAKKPKILILDEATSSIDSQTELKIFEQISKENFTCIVISKSKNITNFCSKTILL